ncbi:hypothetical protein UA08_00842 [Talaromyces atroroseus]|uniref:chitinase n=1 Tax=Talaromyces atroroseus TaxID=1441469 RepID=A0A225B2F1_TALAT|nr:hypothetical protein UA08_00842 [Talaromyces atroroseus]OKL63898.1 hypothetical protein UA08_00842 [Talaromyces atroroseus]
MPSFLKLALAATVAVPFAAAQTYSSCDPLNKTCPADPGLANYTFSTDFTIGESAFEFWNTTDGTVNSTDQGAAFIINEEGEAPTIQTQFYIFFGHVDVKMKIASGTGIISSVVFLSDDLDEIDWEGIGTFNYEIETNYFGKDNTTSYNRATYPNVTTPCDEFHTYSIDWTPARLEWYVDGVLQRTLEYDSAVYGTNYPQTPMVLKLGIWAGGASSEGEGTIEWAGGETDFSDAPFTMYVESVNITNYYPAEYYTYGDKTGDYTSIILSNSTTSSNKTIETTSTSSNGSTTSTSKSNSSSTSASSSSKSTVAASGAASGFAMGPVAVLTAVAMYMFL